MDKNFWKNKQVFITGHEGFLGSWLTKILIEAGARVIGLDIVKNRKQIVLNQKGLRKRIKGIKGNVANMKLVKNIIDQEKPEIIFHLAAEAIVGRSNKNPITTFKSNIEGTWNILEASRGKSFINSIVIASSDKAYGSHDKLPYSEESELKGDHPYDVSKSCADLIAYTYFHTYNLPVCVTRCGNIYGPGDYNFSRIIPDAMRCVNNDKTLIIRSDGKFVRDYVYVEDIVEGYILLAEKIKSLNLAGSAFNFSDENPITVLEILNKLFEIASKKANYKILNKAKYEIKKQYLDSKKARKVLGWKPRYSLQQGIKKTLLWYKSNLV
ncbi:MAG: GDP-mannose 4,6-dehydratase [Candidatus Omnitrophica bacterium]|nr:GDP-mannose 4,6-dehydratase [Candidatus Omnitrophota bacterium]